MTHASLMAWFRLVGAVQLKTNALGHFPYDTFWRLTPAPDLPNAANVSVVYNATDQGRLHGGYRMRFNAEFSLKNRMNERRGSGRYPWVLRFPDLVNVLRVAYSREHVRD